jgi:hypothetical protein
MSQSESIIPLRPLRGSNTSSLLSNILFLSPGRPQNKKHINIKFRAPEQPSYFKTAIHYSQSKSTIFATQSSKKQGVQARTTSNLSINSQNDGKDTKQRRR